MKLLFPFFFSFLYSKEYLFEFKAIDFLSAVYFFRLELNQLILTKKMIMQYSLINVLYGPAI